jgi:hypothetical protein
MQNLFRILQFIFSHPHGRDWFKYKKSLKGGECTGGPTIEIDIEYSIDEARIYLPLL